MTNNNGNMTYLFQKPLHNSESFWTTVFALFMIFSLRVEHKIKFSKFSYRQKPKWEFEQKGYYEINKPLAFENIIIEGSLSKKAIFDEFSIQQDYWQLRPDIVIRKKEENEKRFDIIEVKTNSKLRKDSIEKYANFSKLLREKYFKSDVLIVISHGYKNENSDNELDDLTKNDDIKIILWEEIFEKMYCKFPNLFKGLFDPEKYFEDWRQYLKQM